MARHYGRRCPKWIPCCASSRPCCRNQKSALSFSRPPRQWIYASLQLSSSPEESVSPASLVTKLLCPRADTVGMDKHAIEPRKVMWASAEVTWKDDRGKSFRAPATLEDTSPSGACVRVPQPFTIGSRLTI